MSHLAEAHIHPLHLRHCHRNIFSGLSQCVLTRICDFLASDLQKTVLWRPSKTPQLLGNVEELWQQSGKTLTIQIFKKLSITAQILLTISLPVFMHFPSSHKVSSQSEDTKCFFPEGLGHYA